MAASSNLICKDTCYSSRKRELESPCGHHKLGTKMFDECPNCHRDLRDHIEAVHESGHPVTKCPSCYFPLETYEKAVNELGKYGFYVMKSSQ